MPNGSISKKEIPMPGKGIRKMRKKKKKILQTGHLNVRLEVFTVMKILIKDLEACIFILKLEAARTSEKFVSYHIITRRHNPRTPRTESSP
jgi:hypothetical protein